MIVADFRLYSYFVDVFVTAVALFPDMLKMRRGNQDKVIVANLFGTVSDNASYSFGIFYKVELVKLVAVYRVGEFRFMSVRNIHKVFFRQWRYLM